MSGGLAVRWWTAESVEVRVLGRTENGSWVQGPGRRLWFVFRSGQWEENLKNCHSREASEAQVKHELGLDPLFVYEDLKKCLKNTRSFIYFLTHGFLFHTLIKAFSNLSALYQAPCWALDLRSRPDRPFIGLLFLRPRGFCCTSMLTMPCSRARPTRSSSQDFMNLPHHLVK